MWKFLSFQRLICRDVISNDSTGKLIRDANIYKIIYEKSSSNCIITGLILQLNEMLQLGSLIPSAQAPAGRTCVV